MIGNVYPTSVDIFRTERYNTLDARAQKLVRDYLESLPATDPDGRWHYNGKGDVYVTQFGETTKIGAV